jgi:sulfoxide reductase heme-binding subunit YedZ
MKKRIIWWGVFITASLPSLIALASYIFDPRSLGVDPIEVLLNESGEWALRFLLLSVACSPVKRLGWKGAVRFRRMIGLFAFYYASWHLIIYVFGWVELDVPTLIEDVTERPFIYIGVITWVVLAVLAATSPKFMVKKLKKKWTLIHKGVFFAVVASLVHLWMQSRASALEAVIYIAIAVLLLGERLYRKFRVSKVVKINS